MPFDDEAAELRAHLAELFIRLGRLDDAGEQVTRSLAIAPTVEGRLAAAHLAEARHDPNTAHRELENAVAIAREDGDPEWLERAYLALVDAEVARLHVDDAYHVARELADATPDSVRPRLTLAALAWPLGKLPEAEAALDEALELEPSELEGRLMRAALLVASGRVPEAKQAFRVALDRSEDSVDVAEMFLRWLVGRGDGAEAATEADRLVPDAISDDTLERIVRIERAAGRPARALAAVDKAKARGVGAPGRLALWAGAALADGKDYAGAAARLLAVPSGDADFFESRLRAAEALREAGRYAQADAALTQAAGAVDPPPQDQDQDRDRARGRGQGGARDDRCRRVGAR